MIWIRYTLTELQRIFTDKSVFSVTFVAALFYIAFYPQPYLNEAPRHIPVIAIDFDNSVTSRDLLHKIDTNANISIIGMEDSLLAAKAQLLAHRAYGIIQIPPHFERDVVAGRASPVTFYGDGNYFLIYSKIAAGVAETVQTYGADISLAGLLAKGQDPVAARGLVAPVRLTQIPLFNPQSGYATYTVPAAFVLILQQTLLMGVCLLGFSRASHQNQAELLSRYGGGLLSAMIMVICKTVAYMILYGTLFWIYMILIPYGYDLPRLGDLWSLFWVGTPYLIAICCFGMTLSYLLPCRESTYLLLLPTGMLLFFLSGISWPHEAMPAAVRYFSYLIPSTAGINGLVLVNQMGANLTHLSRELGMLWGLVALYGASAVYLCYRDLRQ